MILGWGNPELSESAASVTRTPPGHPEGYVEDFTNIYSEIAKTVYVALVGKPVPQDVLFPDLENGIAGMIFIERALNSSRNDSKWVLLNN